MLRLGVHDDQLTLEKVLRIPGIAEANASIQKNRFKLDLVYWEQGNKSQHYLGGREQDIERILYFMNPIQALERTLSSQEPKQYGTRMELETAISQYS